MHQHIANPLLWLIGLLAVAAFLSVVLGGKRRTRQRSAAVRSMGFAELPREQVFSNAAAIAGTFPQDQMCTIRGLVAKGQSPAGETLLFDIWWGGRDTVTASVAGFRVDPALPDFRVLYVWSQLLSHALGNALHFVAPTASTGAADAPADANAPGPGGASVAARPPSHALNAKRVERFLKDAEERNARVSRMLAFPVEFADPAFTQHHAVSGADASAVRALLAPVIPALASGEFANIGLHKSGEWLFVYPVSGKLVVAPADYPHWLERMVALVRQLNLHPESPGSAATNGAPPGVTPSVDDAAS